MPTAWRIVKRRHVRSAFDGEGARRFGGRWNSPGRRAVYASSTKSLALLELLVHLDVAPVLPQLVTFAFLLPAALLERCSADDLPRNWRTLRGVGDTRRFGDAWLASRRALALAVPSVIVPEELNYVINPEHRAFARLKFGEPTPCWLDRRLA